jgi:hypothetical protein
MAETDPNAQGFDGLSLLGNLLGVATGGYLTKEAYDRLGNIGQFGFEQMAGTYDEAGNLIRPGLAQELRGMLEFRPYTVTSATGGQFGMTQDPVTGQMSYNLATSPEEQLLQQEQLKRAETLFGRAMADPSAREQEVLGRMEDLASPERQRQRLALEQRLAAQGRLGTRTGMFGGTPEALALERGIAEAQNKAALDAMQFTAQEQQRQAQMGSGMLAAGYVPQAQLLSAVQPGMTAAERQRQAMSEQAGAYGETYATGLQALLQSGLGQGTLVGNLGSGLVSSALGGLFS